MAPLAPCDFKLKRALKVAHSRTDKDLAILNAFFNWCITHRLEVSNPVARQYVSAHVAG
jgi:hypothetical protein